MNDKKFKGIVSSRQGIIFILLALSITISAQNPPYDVYPDIEAPYYRVRYDA